MKQQKQYPPKGTFYMYPCYDDNNTLVKFSADYEEDGAYGERSRLDVNMTHTNLNTNPSPEQQARTIANISPKAKIDNQPFEARIAYYAALKMYEWIKESNL